MLGGNLGAGAAMVPREEFQGKGRVIIVTWSRELKKDKIRSVL